METITLKLYRKGKIEGSPILPPLRASNCIAFPYKKSPAPLAVEEVDSDTSQDSDDLSPDRQPQLSPAAEAPALASGGAVAAEQPVSHDIAGPEPATAIAQALMTPPEAGVHAPDLASTIVIIAATSTIVRSAHNC